MDKENWAISGWCSIKLKLHLRSLGYKRRYGEKAKGQKEVECGSPIELIFDIRILDNESICDNGLYEMTVFSLVGGEFGSVPIPQVPRSRYNLDLFQVK